VNDNHDTIPCHVQVQLQGVHTQLQGLSEGSQGILRCQACSPTMSMDFQESRAVSHGAPRCIGRLSTHQSCKADHHPDQNQTDLPGVGGSHGGTIT
jgi:hypothetical protein